MKRTAILLALLLVPAMTGVRPSAQTKTPFTAKDILEVATVSVLDLSDDGGKVAVSIRKMADNADTDNYRYGDPNYVSPSRVILQVIDTKTGASQLPFKGLVNLRQAAWSHDGKRLGILIVDNPDAPAPIPSAGPQSKDKKKPEKPPEEDERARRGGMMGGRGAPEIRDQRTMELLTTRSFQGPVSRLYIWDTEKSAVTEVPRAGDTAVSLNSQINWTPDDKRLIVSVRPVGFDKDQAGRFNAITRGPVIVQKSSDPFLEWDLLQRSTRERSLVEIEPVTGAPTLIVIDKKISSYNVARDGSFVTFLEDVTEKTDYDEIGGTLNRLELAQRPAVGQPRTIVEASDIKGLQLRWSDDGRTFAYAKKGEVFVQRIDEAKPRSLTPTPPEDVKKEAAAKEAAAKEAAGKDADKADDKKEQFSVSAFSRDGSKLLVTSKKGWYVVEVATAQRIQVLTLNEDEEKNPRRELVAWTPDGSGLLLTESERDRWDRGLVRLDLATRQIKPLVKDPKLYSGFRVSRDGNTIVFSMSDGDQPTDLYATDATFSSVKRLTTANPWIADRLVPKSELVSYRDTDGKQLHGVLRYPVNYAKGKKYPTVFEVYETFFDNGFNARAAFLAGNGYAVFHPSVNLVVGRPGEAWVKGVTAAANRLVEMGVADPEKLGIHGTSYGGYATVLLITQTDRFKAAINISGKVDMVSFYTDSPRLGVRNTHAPEKSQDRIGGTLWEYPERYLEHSAILHADRIKTPLLCITGDQDPNVPASQSREIYYALRRLGKEVEWVRYVNGAHRPPSNADESVDFEQRILAWYDKYLKAESKKTEK